MKLKTVIVIAILCKCIELFWEVWLLRNPDDVDYTRWIQLIEGAGMFLFFFVLYLKVRAGAVHEE